MIGSARARKLRYVTVDLVPLRSLMLALFLAFGIICGHVFSEIAASGVAEKLRQYVNGYIDLSAQADLDYAAVLRTIICFYRAPIAVFFFGFSAFGVIGVPVLLFAHGFLTSFSVSAFAEAMGRESFVLLVILFSIRLVFVLPCTFSLAVAAFDKSKILALLLSGGGKRTKTASSGSGYWYRFAVCLAILFLGCILELWLVPVLLSSI